MPGGQQNVQPHGKLFGLFAKRGQHPLQLISQDRLVFGILLEESLPAGGAEKRQQCFFVEKVDDLRHRRLRRPVVLAGSQEARHELAQVPAGSLFVEPKHRRWIQSSHQARQKLLPPVCASGIQRLTPQMIATGWQLGL